MQSKSQLVNTNDTWNAKKRYKINAVVTYLGSTYQNSTGGNSDPISGNDWFLIEADISGKEDKINKGVPNGYASLGPDGFTLLSEMNPSTLERLVVVADQAARFALTTATVQNGDTVKQLDTGIMYYVKDDTNLSNSNGYELYRAGTAASVPWAGVTGTPTSLTGYGIIPASGDYTTALVTETTDKNYQTDIQKLYNDATSSIQTQLNNRELITNKQNSLTLDGNGEKFTTVDAVNQVIGYVTPEQFGAVGDGITDDTVAFVSALAASNFVYTLKNSVYLIGNVDVIGKKFYGNGTIRKKASSESAFHVKGSGSVIDGLRFDGETASSQPSTDIKLGDGSKNIVISNCVFMSKIYSSISGAVDTTEGGTPYAVNVDGVIVINNVFTKLSSESVGYERPIYLHSVSNITIQGNIIRDTARDAIRLRENDGNCVVDGNQFINIGDPSWPDTQTRDAIDVYWSGNTLTISNNIIAKTAHSGFDIKGSNSTGTDKTSRVIITGNQISHTRYHGIFIQGNVIDPNFYYTESIIVANNIISKCNDDAGTSGYGIYCDGLARFVNIHDNVVTETKGKGIVFNNAYPLTVLGTKNIKITGNMCFNNGRSGVTTTTEAGISVNSIDGVILADNISSNDTSLPNPYQATGIYINSTSTGFPTSKSMIVTGNITRNNITNQIIIDANNQRADNIAVFRDNIQEGTGAIHRPTWQDQRSDFWGTGLPLSGDGIFRRGDIIRNISPSIIGSAGNRYTVTGWERVSATGNTHVLNTDWVEMRTLTDNTEFATLASPAFTGNPTAPTATAGDNDTSIATTAFVTGAIATADAGNVKIDGLQVVTGEKQFSSVLTAQGGMYTKSTTFTTQHNYIASSMPSIANRNDQLWFFNGDGSYGYNFDVSALSTVRSYSLPNTNGTISLQNEIIKLKAYTVGTLPAGTVGDMAYVTDALAPTYNATVVGGGAISVPVFYNGTNWTAH